MTESVANAAEAQAQVDVAPPREEAVVGAVQQVPQPARTGRKKNKGKRPGGPGANRPALTFAGIEGQSAPPRPKQRPSDQGRKSPDGMSKHAARAKAMLEWMPPTSHPADVMTVTLNSEYTRRLFLREFGRAHISLFNIFETIPKRLRIKHLDSAYGKHFDALETSINDELDQLSDKIGNDIQKAQRVLEAQNMTAVAHYSGDGPLEASLPRLTPQICMLLETLPLIDTFAAHVDALWVNRFLSSRQRHRTIDEYRSAVSRLIRKYMLLYQTMSRFLREDELESLGAAFSSATSALAGVEMDSDDVSGIKLSDEDEALASGMVKVTQLDEHGNPIEAPVATDATSEAVAAG